MKATKILKGITKFEEFDFNTLKLYRKDGFCTLAKKEDLSFLYEELWFKNWENFDINHYLVEREDGKKNVIRISDGSYVNEELWFKDWDTRPYEFGSYFNFIRVTRDDGRSTLLRNDFTYLCKNKWAKSWKMFNELYIIMTVNDDGLSTLIKSSDGKKLYDDVWFYSFEKFEEDKILVSNKAGLKTLIYKSDGSFVYNNLWVHKIYDFKDKYLIFKEKEYGIFVNKNNLSETNIKSKISNNIYQNGVDEITVFELYKSNTRCMLAFYDRSYNRYTLLSDDVYKKEQRFEDNYALFTKAKDNTLTVVSKSSLKVVLDNVINFEFFERHYQGCYSYLVTRKDYKNYLYSSSGRGYLHTEIGFKKWDVFNNDMYLVTGDNDLRTLIYKSGLSYVFKDMWFDNWFERPNGYYRVRHQNKINFVKKDDGSFLFDEFIPEEKVLSSISSNYVYLQKDDNLLMYNLKKSKELT